MCKSVNLQTIICKFAVNFIFYTYMNVGQKPGWRVSLLFFVSLFAYWLVLSFVDRAAFVLSFRYKIEDVQDIAYAFLYGLRLDFSLAAYLMALPFLFFIIQQLWLQRGVSPWLLRVYVMLPTFLFAAITIANLPLYESWGEKVSKRALTLGLDTIGGVSSSVDAGMLLQAALMLTIYFVVAHYFYHWVVVKRAKYTSQSLKSTVILFVLGALALFTFIRGGYGRATLNQSAVYFSDDNTANHAAVNTYWSFLKDLTKSTKKSPYQFMSEEEAKAIVGDSLLYDRDSVINVLKTDRPNVILVILEGVVAQVFADLGGEKDITPKMTTLMREGVNFTQAYAAADRSDKGMIAVLSGFPSQGPESIIKYIPKHEKLPAVGQVFDSLGYATSFYHGGQSEFYNFKSFMLTHGIDKVVDNANFPINAQRNSWGVYDHLVAKRLLNSLKKEKKPFFSIFYTLVNHEPFDLSPSYAFGNKTKADAYRSTTFYTDTMLFNFIEEAKQQDWYENTIVVVTSDHGHVYPTEKYGLDRPERYHIPLFVFGGALKEEYRGKKVDEVVSQLDIASTLAGFVQEKTMRFKYSQDLFALRRKHLAFYNSNAAFGVINNEGAVSYDMLKRNISYSTFPKDSVDHREKLIHVAKAYYQTVFNDFLKY
ncbi:Phosphoglycerol transferase MdoB [Sphingobacterium wenxiniae]|uniref:Phosphoglycerol transferase MdoB n=2 Tax=Sphingobacterium wenxiniae TaxID=683125 RepID=A0A1I6T008_9SPHI|nr:Phosphoglycerol transferase MdoB [Sphingobacterium wenxiniae]